MYLPKQCTKSFWFLHNRCRAGKSYVSRTPQFMSSYRTHCTLHEYCLIVFNIDEINVLICISLSFIYNFQIPGITSTVSKARPELTCALSLRNNLQVRLHNERITNLPMKIHHFFRSGLFGKEIINGIAGFFASPSQPITKYS